LDLCVGATVEAVANDGDGNEGQRRNASEVKKSAHERGALAKGVAAAPALSDSTVGGMSASFEEVTAQSSVIPSR
jgi:hypothetical protein